MCVRKKGERTEEMSTMIAYAKCQLISKEGSGGKAALRLNVDEMCGRRCVRDKIIYSWSMIERRK